MEATATARAASPRKRVDRIALSKPFVFALCLLPLAWLAWDTLHGQLGTDPVARLEHRSGIWALRLLLATLAITPLRLLTKWHWLTRYRRMLGLFAFFYASVHLAIYLVVDLGGFWSQLFEEIAKKPYITVGFAAWLLMIPLAVTSTKAMMRRLGPRWLQLHRLVYVVGLCGALHFMWLVKSGNTIAVREPVIYLAILLVLLAARVPGWLRRRRLPRGNARAGGVA
ncbi:protein-methionine-sulfoxide reductase heme-binding subunit MsrQ [Dokdonella sp.]|uniref:sulfite oxidase heme-binding subunit YedZ n=1 Tax=Dokdonella sp. TaxID=2291710 RepID=UPI001B103247|nr:protein-methionine-sulfoxide reductase heme-binding subunit MsrQ [Dokdonella sp.]MBO9664503.1 sulfoxide reductase heme-binding subunit YedZ [Dokdonella sp.]